MKRTLKAFMAASALVLCLIGCNKIEVWLTGSEVRFSIRSVSDPMTKTEYGNIINPSGTRLQSINWVSGDVLRMACAQASTSEAGTSTSADYVTTVDANDKTIASISLASNNDKGLRWGSESVDHIFYGVYPSPYVKSGDSFTADGALTGAIPQTQPATSVSTSAPYVAKPDMKNQYMVAKTTKAAGTRFEDGDVILSFIPITTAIEFEVTNAMTEDLAISSIELISTSYNLSGGFTTSLSGLSETNRTYPTVTAVTGAKKNAAVTFGTSGVTLGANEKLTFTIFLLPESDLNDLTFRINKKGTDAGYIQTTLKSDASTWLSFARCKKHFVKGLFADEGAKWGMGPLLSNWIPQTSSDTPVTGADLALEASLVPWVNGGGGDVNLVNQFYYNFCLGTTYVESNVKTDTTFKNTTDASPVTYIDIYSKRKQGQSGTPENHGWKILSYRVGDGASVNVNGTSFNAGGLTVSANTATNKLSITAAKRTGLDKGSNGYWRNNSTPARTDNLEWSPADWSGTTVDLSRYDFETDTKDAHKMTTANCYIIRHAGTYRIPLVYGNGVVNGSENYDAFSPGDWTGVTNYLGNFTNHRGYTISDPFIENNTTDGKAMKKKRNNAQAATGSEIVWQSTSGVISNLSITTATGPFSANNVRYLEFKVNQNVICQSNAVIAVKDDKGIMWSWHIWITNDPAVGDPAISHNNYRFFPMNDLGWVEGAEYSGRDDVTIYLEQATSGKIVEIVVSQPEVPAVGGGLFYQWGRKDPMRASGNTIKAGSVTLADAIKNPKTFYTISSTGDWCSTSYKNLWMGKEYSTDASVETSNMFKTIYDPSPVGYKVPGPNAFTGFTAASIEEFFMPTGYDERKTGTKGGAGGLYFWTSVSDSTVSSGRSFKGSMSSAAAETNNKSEGFAVRPVTEY